MIIDENIKNETKHCTNDFDCLKNVNHTCLLIKVDSHVNGKVLFIDCKNHNCHYKMSYGNGTICNCPTRNEIYRKYKK